MAWNGLLSGMNEQRSANDQASLSSLQQASGVVGLLSHLQQQQAEQQMRAALGQSGGDPEAAMRIALQTGNIAGASKLAPLVKQAREAKLTEQMSGIGQMTPDQLDALGQRLAATGHPGAATVMATADRRRALEQNKAALTSMQSTPVGLQAGQMVPGTLNAEAGTQGQMVQSVPPEDTAAFLKVAQSKEPMSASPQPGDVSPLRAGGRLSFLQNSPYVGDAARALQARIDSGAVGLTPAQIETQVSNLSNHHVAMTNAQTARDQSQAGKIEIRNLGPEPPVQTHTDAQGRLWERQRGGNWQLAKGPEGEGITGKIASNPAAEALYKDYANHPMVKEANDIEAKIRPLTDYMIEFKKTGKSVNANDAALAKMYLSVTTPVGSRAYTMDQKALAALPNLGDRLGNMASSFFAGKDLTDQTRTEMFNYIVQRYKSLDAARQEQKALTTRRAQARGVPAEQVFGGE